MLHTVIKQKLDCRSLHPYLLRSTSLLLVNLLHLFVKSRNLGVMRITRICILWYCHSYITAANGRRANYQSSRASKRWLAKTAKLQRNSTAIEYAEWPPQQWTCPSQTPSVVFTVKVLCLSFCCRGRSSSPNWYHSDKILYHPPTVPILLISVVTTEEPETSASTAHTTTDTPSRISHLLQQRS